MTIRNLLIAAVVAWLAAIAGLAWMMSAAGMSPAYLPDNFGFMSGACAVLAGLAGGLGVVGGLVGSRVTALAGAGGAVGWGALGALYVEVIIQQVLASVGPTRLAIVAVSHAEALSVLLIGLTGAVVSLGVLALRRRGR